MQRRRWAVVVTALVLGGLSAPAASAHSPSTSPKATGWYLALGDSLAAGYQPNQGDDKTGGYVGGVLEAVRAHRSKTRLVNVACSGETVVTMVNGGRCAYEEGSQLAEAVEFLHDHRRTTRLITIDIGANDVQRCVSRDPLGIDAACIQQGLGDVQRLLPQVLSRLHRAAPGARIVVLNYYNPFLAAFLNGPAGQDLAATSMALQATLNTIVAAAARSVHADVADIATAFHSTDVTPVDVAALGGVVPTNVATICGWTWMCLLGDIHANDTGYAVMAATVARRL